MARERRGKGGFSIPWRPLEEALGESIKGQVVSEVLGWPGMTSVANLGQWKNLGSKVGLQAMCKVLAEAVYKRNY